jgi:hypothetical protein
LSHYYQNNRVFGSKKQAALFILGDLFPGLINNESTSARKGTQVYRSDTFCTDIMVDAAVGVPSIQGSVATGVSVVSMPGAAAVAVVVPQTAVPIWFSRLVTF